MQTPSEKTTRMLLMNTEEEVFDSIIKKEHPFRKLNELINFDQLVAPLRKLYSTTGAVGIDIEKGTKAPIIQFGENYSDCTDGEGSSREHGDTLVLRLWS